MKKTYIVKANSYRDALNKLKKIRDDNSYVEKLAKDIVAVYKNTVANENGDDIVIEDNFCEELEENKDKYPTLYKLYNLGNTDDPVAAFTDMQSLNDFNKAVILIDKKHMLDGYKYKRLFGLNNLYEIIDFYNKN